jgi:hypothetical protein
MCEPLDVFDFVEGEVERGEFGEGVEALDVRDEVVIEIYFGECGCGVTGNVDGFYAVLSQAETL